MLMIACYVYVNYEKRRKTEENCGHLSSLYWLYNNNNNNNNNIYLTAIGL